MWIPLIIKKKYNVVVLIGMFSSVNWCHIMITDECLKKFYGCDDIFEYF